MKKNEGEVPQYYVEGNHEAIISPAVFDLVQAELAKRTRGGSRYSGVSIFSNKIRPRKRKSSPTPNSSAVPFALRTLWRVRNKSWKTRWRSWSK